MLIPYFIPMEPYLGYLWGQSQTYKTFLLNTMAVAVASGTYVLPAIRSQLAGWCIRSSLRARGHRCAYRQPSSLPASVESYPLFMSRKRHRRLSEQASA